MPRGRVVMELNTQVLLFIMLSFLHGFNLLFLLLRETKAQQW